MAGRVLANGFQPASGIFAMRWCMAALIRPRRFGATSVGFLSIRRFLRPVSYQNLPEGLWLRLRLNTRCAKGAEAAMAGETATVAAAMNGNVPRCAG